MAENYDSSLYENGASKTTSQAIVNGFAEDKKMDSKYLNGQVNGYSAKSKTQNIVHKPSKPKGPSKAQAMNKMYSLPAPVQTFPLPFFSPTNPLSLLQLIYTWVSQTLSPPSSHPENLYQGWYSPETMSVHVTDQRSIRALWERGFYGKGTLSRSEPSWLDREKRRRGAAASQTSEEVTRKRRQERQQIKWERARKEREAIEQTLLQEQGIIMTPEAKPYCAPVGPMELLLLPNSLAELEMAGETHKEGLLNLENEDEGNGSAPAPSVSEVGAEGGGGSEARTLQQNGRAHPNGSEAHDHVPPQTKSPKSVRFSPQIEQTTFLRHEPPSPELAATVKENLDEPEVVIADQEHLQLTLEEALFLSFGFGVLDVLDPATQLPLSTTDLFTIGRRSSTFDPRSYTKMPDDTFMLSYVVYHHFRSLGWVVRSGVKFGVDYLLYNRGPPFSHAEFAITILPAYSHPYWSETSERKAYVAKKTNKSWSWLHCINRVNTQVKKTLVLVYVDIPSPLGDEIEDDMAISEVLRRYKVREIVLKRWSANRSRD